MNRDQMIKAIFDGKKVRRKTWSKNGFICYDSRKNGFVDQDGREVKLEYYPFDADDSTDNPYEEYMG